MAFCTQCGNKLNDGAAFCGQCGAKVFSGTAQSQSANNGFINKLNSTVQKAVNGTQQVVGDISGNQSANSDSNNTSHKSNNATGKQHLYKYVESECSTGQVA